MWKGESVNYIAARIDGQIHGFDSFDGLPEDWNADNPVGTFKLPGLPPVRKNVKHVQGGRRPVWLHQGVFDMLAEKFVAGKEGEWKAFTEFRAQRNAEVEFLRLCDRGQPAALRSSRSVHRENDIVPA